MSRRKPRASHSHTTVPPNLLDALVQCGVEVPEECVSVELKVSADSLTQVVYTCNVTGATAHKIGKALQLQAVKDRLSRLT